MVIKGPSGGPFYPVLFIWGDGETTLYENEEEMVIDLEWFDSEVKRSENDHVEIFDSRGRSLRVRIEKFEIVWCEEK